MRAESPAAPALAVCVTVSGRAEIRNQVEAQLPKRNADVAALEEELRDLRAEQKRIAKAVALADDAPELVSELRHRSARIQQLEGQISTAKKTPEELSKLVKQIAASSRTKPADLRTALGRDRPPGGAPLPAAHLRDSDGPPRAAIAAVFGAASDAQADSAAST